ncbi:hypothetical protein ONZ51_g4745 [Trametes cubensis]|uniref:Phosphatidylserine synthase 2 n=1 Tax=Trametes cubensis TaxID=1111947 RepID=A0AAD7TWA2_9APHY|nr:hypothetical protein ONZ51_g4745 [Trametes cubensis]
MVASSASSSPAPVGLRASATTNSRCVPRVLGVPPLLSTTTTFVAYLLSTTHDVARGRPDALVVALDITYRRIRQPALTAARPSGTTEFAGFGWNAASVQPGFDADRKEPYTQITPFQEQNDTSVEFFYKPITLTALGVGMAVLAYVAMTQDVLKEGEEKKRVGAYAAVASFLLFSMIQFRDGPFVRPHPAFWRVVLGINLLYELAMVFLLFQDLDSARAMMKYLDPNLGKPLPEKSYAENCELTVQNIWNAIDIFCLAHALGWFGKALILRDYWFCWILSVAFEFAEYSLQHQLANFAECWWDHWILDVLVCNWLGTYLGMKTCQYFEVKHYTWRGFRQTRGIRSKTKRVISQFSPHDWTTFKWEGTASFGHYFTVVLLLAVFLAAELNPFYLKVGPFP